MVSCRIEDFSKTSVVCNDRRAELDSDAVVLRTRSVAGHNGEVPSLQVDSAVSPSFSQLNAVDYSILGVLQDRVYHSRNFDSRHR